MSRLVGATQPPFAYFGGKTRLAEQIAATFPKHEHYVEPFAGSLAVLLAKPRSRQETVNDLDRDLVAFWRVLRERPDALTDACYMTPHSRVEHGIAWDESDAANDIERARRAWVKLTQSHANQRDHKSGWKHQQGSNVGISQPQYQAAYVARMPACARRLIGVTLECRPALEVIRDYGKHPQTLLYVDPPYFGDRSDGYAVEMRDEGEHRELAEALATVAASVVLSGYGSPLYDVLYRDWNRVEISTFTGQGKARQPRIEVLWSNYETAEHLFSAAGLSGEAMEDAEVSR